MVEPSLVIMAAGMGSRFGGLKQMTPADDRGHVIMDFALYDARRAGFKHVVFVIKEEFSDAFRESIGKRVESHFERVDYAYQSVDLLPDGFFVPPGRTKPWGTAHAVLCAKPYIDGPFAVINADDYYGPEAFEKIYSFLVEERPSGNKLPMAMVAYRLKHTLTENGTVSRGVCTVDECSNLLGIVEREKIERRQSGICYLDADTDSWIPLAEDTPVSMNMWGFGSGFMDELVRLFPVFLREKLGDNPEKAEFYLPSAVWSLVEEEKAGVTVLYSEDQWFGVTYKEDRQQVENAVADLKRNGVYPEELWSR